MDLLRDLHRCIETIFTVSAQKILFPSFLNAIFLYFLPIRNASKISYCILTCLLGHNIQYLIFSSFLTIRLIYFSNYFAANFIEIKKISSSFRRLLWRQCVGVDRSQRA